jgi:hypothetical protein
VTAAPDTDTVDALMREAIEHEFNTIPAAPRGPIYGAVYELARHPYTLIYPYADLCWDCCRAFGDNNIEIVVTRANVDDEPFPLDGLNYLHPGCWESRKENWGDPWPIPQTRVAWETGPTTPGTATQGNIALSDEGTVTITIDGRPTVGIDTRTGTVTVWPGSEQFHIAARFAPDPQPETDGT